jgi:ribA/ribD-fused uncharacterized protein
MTSSHTHAAAKTTRTQRASTKPKPEPVFFKQLPDVLPCSLFYLGTNQADELEAHPLLAVYLPHLPCWVPHATIAQAFFKSDALVHHTEQARGGAWVWAPEFSNAHSTFQLQEPTIVVDGEEYPGGPEVYFQLHKFQGTPHMDEADELLRPADGSAVDPLEAWEIGQRWAPRRDWNAVRVNVMVTGVHAKFSQHEAFASLLASTGKHPLVQLKPGDDFWGTGAAGDGDNMLGEILQHIRDSAGKK